MVSLQGSLLDLVAPEGPRPLGSLIERLELGDGAWLDVARNWLAGADDLFQKLIDSVPWQSERRRMYDRMVDVPRLMRFYEAGEALPDRRLDRCRAELNHWYGAGGGDPFVTAGLACYRHGGDSVAWHGDTIGRGSTEDTTVAILSLGSPRRFLLRRRGGGPAARYELASGDLVVMGGSCQRTWEHAVPKSTRVHDPRISVQFRPAGVR